VILLIAGDGTLRPELEELAKQSRGSENVRFVGYVPIESAPLYYSLAWVYVLPSVTVPTGKEPWGLVVNEAFNQGVPVITTEAVGAAAGGLVQQGINGYVIPEKDSETLTLRLRELIDDVSLRQEFSRNAKRIVTSWNYERNILGYRSAIEYVLNNL
jgi:glycosyltransferase involved in cell wall biosynthesis